MENPKIELLDSGYLRIRFNDECWAQFPSHFQGEVIPDAYIFHADWNRERINCWWRERVGVPFKQTRYLPKELEGRIHFSDFLKFKEDWSVTNRERGMLIDKSISGTLSAEERIRLEALQAYAEYHMDKLSPRITKLLQELEKKLLSSPPGRM